jgi:hypothetical protein
MPRENVGVFPAKAGNQLSLKNWIPVFTGTIFEGTQCSPWFSQTLEKAPKGIRDHSAEMAFHDDYEARWCG